VIDLIVRLSWTLLIAPLLPALADIIPSMRARARRRPLRRPYSPSPVHDFTVLVPIYGDIRYLENVDYLSRYGSRVMLCTTSDQSQAFFQDLDRIASTHGFRVEVFHVTSRRSTDRRQVSGTIRDRLIQQATELVDSSYVVCIDADTVTDGPLEDLVGTVRASGLDLAGVRLVPSNLNKLLGRLQAHEYRMAMRMRRIIPYITPGALQISTSQAHRTIMRRHSLFFQGNDAEMGLLGQALGYKVGYLPVEVPTTVPDTVVGWWRQRFAWAGGEFRIFVVNLPLFRRHPLFMAYGFVLVFMFVPFRLAEVTPPGRLIGCLIGLYIVIVSAMNWQDRDLALLVYPLYGLFISLVLAPLGALSYAIQARQSRNPGLVRPRRPLHFQRRSHRVPPSALAEIAR
jgi:cellulose synthase/poly-beta-1,6-N-acetylglucosamine synthase-like glycosyltransferase